jgi:hypothetical protein
MEVSGQLHAPRERAPGTHWIGGWVGPSVGLDAVDKIKFLHCRESIPGLPSPSLYRLSYPDSLAVAKLTLFLRTTFLKLVSTGWTARRGYAHTDSNVIS